MASTPKVAVRAGCALGEGVLWDEQEQRVYWVDIIEPAIHSFDPATGRHSRWPMPERIGFIVRRADGRGFVAGFKSGLVTVENAEGQLRITPLVGYVPGGPDDRINDGFVDPDGRLWFGTMDDRFVEPTGYLHVYDGTGTPRREDGPYKVTNGPCMSPDGRVLYHTDTDNGLIRAFDVTDDGRLTNGRPFVTFTDRTWGFPDGMAADVEGHIWVCHWGGARITRFRPDGTVERVIAFPTPNITKCAFGGADLKTLYVTSASGNIDRTQDADAGALFAVDVDVSGLVTHRYRPAGTA